MKEPIIKEHNRFVFEDLPGDTRRYCYCGQVKHDTLDARDRELINFTQKDLPITSRPYAAIAEKFGIAVEDIFTWLQRLKDEGYIRRVGASFNPRRIGYTSTLVAFRAPDDRLEEVVDIINSLPQVTHNYEREHEYNIWFTLIARSRGEIKEILKRLKAETGIQEMLELPATHIFKIDAGLKLADGEC